MLTLEVFPQTVLLGVYDAGVAAHYPTRARVVARVRDGQGHPVDGVAVAFELEPQWARSAMLSPSHTVTRGGIARTTFSDPQSSGRVRLTARVEHTAAQTEILVQTYEERPERD
jgi:hypothetical protein